MSSVKRRCCCCCCCYSWDNIPQFTNNLEVRWFSSQFRSIRDIHERTCLWATKTRATCVFVCVCVRNRRGGKTKKKSMLCWYGCVLLCVKNLFKYAWIQFIQITFFYVILYVSYVCSSICRLLYYYDYLMLFRYKY